MTTTWVLAADCSRARFFQTDSASAPLEEFETLIHSKSRLHDRELTSDLPGKVKNPGGIGGHAFEQPTDPKRHEAEIFAGTIVHYLTHAQYANRFDHLILVAEPVMLGLLRHRLPKHLKPHIDIELNKNLVAMSAAEVRAHLPEHLLH